MHRMLAAAALAVAWSAVAAMAQTPAQVPGATVEELFELLAQGSPELAAMAEDRRAALERSAAAGALPDPTFRFTADEIDRTGGGRQDRFLYGIEQEIPAWGKRELRSRVAAAEVDAARARESGINAELTAKVKLAFADTYLAHRSRGIAQERLEAARALAALSVARYGQGLGTTADALRAETERAQMQAELHRLEADARSARARINGVLGRAADAPLAEPARLSPVPADERLRLAVLRDRLVRGNPAVQIALAERDAADQGQRLAEREWYPDVSLTLTGIDRRDNGPPGFMAGIGVRIPLQLEARRAAIREAGAKANAAAARRAAAERSGEAELEEAIGNLASARAIDRLASESLVPLADAAYQAALLAYAQGRAAEITAVLDAHHRVREARLEALKAAVEQRRQLARIERLIGGAP
jgi:outer membrane protein, heavy metal efflux system